jgi:hypothetical protein
VSAVIVRIPKRQLSRKQLFFYETGVPEKAPRNISSSNEIAFDRQYMLAEEDYNEYQDDNSGPGKLVYGQSVNEVFDKLHRYLNQHR